MVIHCAPGAGVWSCTRCAVDQAEHHALATCHMQVRPRFRVASAAAQTMERISCAGGIRAAPARRSINAPARLASTLRWRVLLTSLADHCGCTSARGSEAEAMSWAARGGRSRRTRRCGAHKRRAAAPRFRPLPIGKSAHITLGCSSRCACSSQLSSRTSAASRIAVRRRTAKQSLCAGGTHG